MSKPLKEKRLDQYYRAEAQHKIYKLTTEQDSVWLYWVMIHRLSDGSFQHGRGRDRMVSMERAEEVCRMMAIPATKAEYTTILHRYLLTDQTARTLLLSDEKKQ